MSVGRREPAGVVRALPPASTRRVCAVVVAYYPTLAMLRELLIAVSPQVGAVVIVDNTPEAQLAQGDLGSWSEVPVEWIALRRNAGVAAAHNAGLEWARDKGFAHVLLLDQDSVPEPEMVGALLEAEQTLISKGNKVAAVAPQFVDVLSGREMPFVKMMGWRVRKLVCAEQRHTIVNVEYAISSGTLIRLDSFLAIGGMDDGLFIDYVDIEWGFRAALAGYQLFGVCSARMRHQLGDRIFCLPLPFGFVWSAPVRSPLRHYYHFRNAVTLYKRTYVPLVWVLNDAVRLVLKFLFYSLLTAPRLQHIKMMSLGVWHGLRNRRGPLIAN